MKVCSKCHLREASPRQAWCALCFSSYERDQRTPESKLRKSRATKKWFEKNRAKRAEYDRNRRLNNPQYKIAHNLRRRLRMWLQRSGSAVADLGCTVAELRKHLESKFLPGMTWENYGSWHIDHIKPLASFDLTDREQFLQAVHYTNLQPLWATDNLRKRDRICA